jgi:hypothetical protein
MFMGNAVAWFAAYPLSVFKELLVIGQRPTTTAYN